MYDYETDEPIYDETSIYRGGELYPFIRKWRAPKSNLIRIINAFSI